MAKTTSIIRYKYKADRDFESVQFEGMGCSLGDLKRTIIEKSARAGSHHPKDDYDLIISDPATHEEYRDNAEMIPRNTSVIVTRRIRGAFESLTPSSNRKSAKSFDETVNEYIRPAMAQSTAMTLSGTHTPSSSAVDSQAVPLEMFTQPSPNAQTSESTEDERIKEMVKTSQSRYFPSHRASPSYTCHNCKQPGHLRNQCPLLLQSSSTNTNGHGVASSVGGIYSSKHDGTKPTSRHYNNSYGNRPHYRGVGHSRNEPVLRTTKGIPRDGLIHVPQPVPGAFRDQNGAPVVPRQMAQLLLEKSDQKADAIAQRARQFQEKGVLPPAPPPSMLPPKSADEDVPPEDLLCALCKQVYHDAVIAPCCHNSFCDECIRTALIESEDHQCPSCHRQHVPIGQINPNLFLRKCVNNWREDRPQKSSYPYMPTLQSGSSINYAPPQTTEHHSDAIAARSSPSINSEEWDEVDAPNLVAPPAIPQRTMRTAPIVIRMQTRGQEPSSPLSVASTAPADITADDEKALSLKDAHSEISATDDDTRETISHAETDINGVEGEGSVRGTPPSQTAPVNTIQSSPPTTTTTTAAAMSATPSVIPHHYPTPSHLVHHQPHVHHGMMYSPQMPPTGPTDFYPVHRNHYLPPVHLQYPVHHHHPLASSPMLPVSGFHYYPGHPSFPSAQPHLLGAPYVQSDALNAFHLTHYETTNASALQHPGTIYAATATSTLISHHHSTANQTPPGSVDTTVSKTQDYMKQRHFQRRNHSNSRHRSPSYSSHSSSDSRHSSFSRRDSRHYRRRSSRSGSRRRANVHRRTDARRTSPIRDHHRRKRRSPSPRNRSRASPADDRHSSKHRRSSPRSYRATGDRERRRSPRPPPTIQQSTQRTIVYVHESSSSKANADRNRVHHRTTSRSRSHSRRKDDPKASSSPITEPSDRPVKTLASRIEPVTKEKPLSSVLSNSSNKIPPMDATSSAACKDSSAEANSNHQKKRKEREHRHDDRPKKHRRRRSKSRTRHRSKDKNTGTKALVDRTPSTVEVL